MEILRLRLKLCGSPTQRLTYNNKNPVRFSIYLSRNPLCVFSLSLYFLVVANLRSGHWLLCVARDVAGSLNNLGNKNIAV